MPMTWTLKIMEQQLYIRNVMQYWNEIHVIPKICNSVLQTIISSWKKYEKLHEEEKQTTKYRQRTRNNKEEERTNIIL